MTGIHGTAQSGAASASGSTAQAADGRAWNTAARAERTLYSERPAQDARMLSVPESSPAEAKPSSESASRYATTGPV